MTSAGQAPRLCGAGTPFGTVATCLQKETQGPYGHEPLGSAASSGACAPKQSQLRRCVTMAFRICHERKAGMWGAYAPLPKRSRGTRLLTDLITPFKVRVPHCLKRPLSTHRQPR